jgi:hypothetical protein
MAAPVTLIVLVAAGQAASPLTIAMAQATHDAFAGAVTDTRETRAVPTDADALLAETISHPDAVAQLLWEDSRHRHAILRMHFARSQRWVERSFEFSPSDPAVQRGRTLGFAAAAMLPEAAEQAAAPGTDAVPEASRSLPLPADDSPGPPASGAPGPPAPSAAAEAASTPPDRGLHPGAPDRGLHPGAPDRGLHPGAETTSSGTTGVGPAKAEAERPAETAPGRSRFALDVMAAGSIGVGSTAQGIGGGAAVHWFVLPALSVRLGANARVGSLDAAAATLSTIDSSAGIAVHPRLATQSRPFGLSVRADYVLSRQSATHYDSDDPGPVTNARWLSGVDALVEGNWLFASEIGLLAGIGLEDFFASTYIYVRNAPKLTLPPVRALADVGLRLRF